MTKRLAITAAIMATMLVVAACSSSSPTAKPVESASTTAAASTPAAAAADKEAAKQQYIADAAAICTRSTDQAIALASEHVPKGVTVTPQAVVVFIQLGLDMGAATLAEMRALTPPPGDEARLEAMYNEVEAIDEIKYDLIDALNAQSKATVESLLGKEDLAIDKIDAQLDSYGMTGCGSEATARQREAAGV